MPELWFLVATYNEKDEIVDLLESVRPYVDKIVVSDDGSEDNTVDLARPYADFIVASLHTASCEETRLRGLQAVPEGVWVLILDADERILSRHLEQIRPWLLTEESKRYTHMYFGQDEYIDGNLTRSFAKIKMGIKGKLRLPEGLHQDIQANGDSTDKGWRIIHRKSRAKQELREREYIENYKRKIAEGKMTPERAAEVTAWHYFIKE